MRRIKRIIKPDDFFLVLVYRKADKEKRRKLAPIQERPIPFKQIDTENKTVVIEWEDRLTEHLSRSRVTLEPMPKYNDELLEDKNPGPKYQLTRFQHGPVG